MANKQNESTMQWKIDIANFKKNIQDAKRQISLANAEFKTATAGAKNWGNSITGVEAKIKQLNTTSKNQKTVLAELEKQYDVVAREMGEDSEAAQRLKVQIEYQKAAIAKTDKQLQDYNGKLSTLQTEQAKADTVTNKLTRTIDEQEDALADLKAQYANAVLEYGKNSKEAKALAKEISSLSGELAENKTKLTEADKAADGLDKSLDNAGDSARDAADGGFTVLKGALANLAADAISKAVDALKELGQQIIEVGKQSISNYANYEQLVGGVETIFKESADIVQNYANNAYKTAGISANEYMENVTSFSASLLQGLNGDTAEAARIADVAITDMSDNANKYGSDMTSLQNAYQGFAKNNFTMLDNLKLGYGGTQTEMVRLINDSGILEKEIEKIDEVSFDQMILAIHEIQTQMDITGTTSKEAATTIEGSKNSMIASWDNLLTGLADDNADVESLFDTFIENVGTYAENLLPRIKELAENAVNLIKDEFTKRFPEATEAIKTFVDVVKEAFNWIIDNGDTIKAVILGIATAVGVYTAYTTALNVMKNGWMSLAVVQKLVAAGQAALNAVMALNPIGLVVAAIAGLIAAFVLLWKKSEAFRNFWINLWEKIKTAADTVIKAIVKFFTGAWDKIKKVWGNFDKFMSEKFGGAWKIIKAIWGNVAAFFKLIWDNIKSVFSAVKAVLSGDFKGAWEAIKGIWGNVKTYFQTIWNNIKTIFSVVGTWFKDIFNKAWTGIKTVFAPVVTFFTGIWNGIKKVFAPVINFFKTLFGNAWIMIENIWKLAAFFFSTVWNAIKKVFEPVINWFRNIFSSAWEGIKAIWNAGVGFFTGVWDGIKSVFNVVATWFKTIFTNAWNNIKAAWGAVSSFFSGVWNSIKNVFNGVTSWFKNIFTNAWNAIKGVFSSVGSFFGGIWDTIKSKFSDIGTKVGEAISGTFKKAINAVLSTAENVLNAPIRAINGLIDKINSIPGINLTKLNTFSLPRMAQGGVLDNGARAIIAGEAGAEAIVPLERNTKWIKRVVQEMLEQLDVAGAKDAVNGNLSSINAVRASVASAAGGLSGRNQTVIFNQYNNSPKALDRLSIYRDTNSMLFGAKVRLNNV